MMFLDKLFSEKKALAPMPSKVLPVPQAKYQQQSPQDNPFLLANNSEHPMFMGTYGVNRPLAKPMFLGYKDDKPLYGGSRLFILY